MRRSRRNEERFRQNATQFGKPIARVRTTRRFACRGQNALAEARGGSVKLQGESQRGKFLVGNIGGDWMEMEGNVRDRELAIRETQLVNSQP